MQVIDIYDKNSDLRSHGRNIFKVMDEFMSKFPLEYRKRYDINLSTLELMRCDRLYDRISTARYDTYDNIILFVRSNSLGHELFHVASNDREKKKSAFEDDIGLDQGLIEGMTEYLTMKAYGLTSPDSYPFEVFMVTMLEDIPDLFKYYFIPNHAEFIKLFPSKKDIYNLIFSSGIYHENSLEYLNKINQDDGLIDIMEVRRAIKNVINDLITIELSIQKDYNELKNYGVKFLDLIGSEDIRLLLSMFDNKYYRYAQEQVKTRIFRR